MGQKYYKLSEKEYNDILNQLVISDNVVLTDKEKFLKEEPDLFWMTDNSKQIKMLESKTPLPEPSKDNKLDRDKVEEIMGDVVLSEYEIVTKILQLIPQQPTEKAIREILEELIDPDGDYIESGGGCELKFNKDDIDKAIQALLNLYKGEEDG